jgi:hypothetical protein
MDKKDKDKLIFYTLDTSGIDEGKLDLWEQGRLWEENMRKNHIMSLCLSDFVGYRKKQNILYESIIHTHPIDKMLEAINNSGLLEKSVGRDEYTHGVVFGKHDIQVAFNVVVKEENINPIEHLITSYGYYISQKIKRSDGLYFLKVYPKYDIEVTDQVKKKGVLYHATRLQTYEEKISKMGLCPKSRDNFDNHPGMVFFATTPKYAKEIFEDPEYGMNAKGEYVILEIHLYEKPPYRFFVDIRTRHAVYSYDNIYPQFIHIHSKFSLGPEKINYSSVQFNKDKVIFKDGGKTRQIKANVKKDFSDEELDFLSKKAFSEVRGKWQNKQVAPLPPISKKVINEGEKTYEQLGYLGGFTKVRFNNKYNLLDKNGNLISSIWFDGIDEFKNGVAKVKLGNKYNFIDKNGELLTPNQWFDDTPKKKIIITNEQVKLLKEQYY